MRYLTALFLLLFIIGSQPAYSAAGGGGGGGGRASGSSQRSAAKMTPKQKAVVDYKKGIVYRDKAWKYEEQAAAAPDDKKKEKYIKKAQKEYKKAIKKYEAAIKKVPDFYQAHSSLGYALRKTGDIEGSLAAYDTSVKINPVYPEAIEYRAETHL
ncbi:MAG: tetratricopeptide (TPR) repeat protein [Gammaproteobacteria bacterium]|jgi:tetratricopeptide (TPR) repeat protein